MSKEDPRIYPHMTYNDGKYGINVCEGDHITAKVGGDMTEKEMEKFLVDLLEQFWLFKTVTSEERKPPKY